jgi:PAS domain-containing protein
VSDLTLRPQDLGIGHLFGEVRDAVIVANATTGRIVLWNPSATEVFGYTHSEALEMSVEDLVPEHLKARHIARPKPAVVVLRRLMAVVAESFITRRLAPSADTSIVDSSLLLLCLLRVHI